MLITQYSFTNIMQYVFLLIFFPISGVLVNKDTNVKVIDLNLSAIFFNFNILYNVSVNLDIIFTRILGTFFIISLVLKVVFVKNTQILSKY